MLNLKIKSFPKNQLFIKLDLRKIEKNKKNYKKRKICSLFL
jgi:hypothetical protein